MRALLLILVLALAGCSAEIHHGLDERAANEIVTVLIARGIAAEKVPEKGKKPTWAISVASADVTAALRTLTELELPRVRPLSTPDVVAVAGLVDTPGAERLRHLEAQEGDLELALGALDGVVTAAVELVLPPPPRPGLPAVPSKASVLLRVTSLALARLEPQRDQLKALVAGAVDGLKPDDVVLVLDVVSARGPVTPLEEARPTRPPPAPEHADGAATADASGLLRPLVLLLGLALSLLAVVVVWLAVRLRAAGAPEVEVARAPQAVPGAEVVPAQPASQTGKAAPAVSPDRPQARPAAMPAAPATGPTRSPAPVQRKVA